MGLIAMCTPLICSLPPIVVIRAVVLDLMQATR